MTPKHFQIILNLHRPPRNSSGLLRNFSGTSYLCTLATSMFPKRSPTIVKTISVLPSIRECTDMAETLPPMTVMEPLMTMMVPVHSRINHR